MGKTIGSRKESNMATRRSLAPLTKEAGKRQRQKVVALKQARKNGKAKTK
jgi:hypothetical protein